MRRLALALGLALIGRAAAGQISPGELSQAHAKLEGSASCLACHQASKGVAAGLCLACHKELAARIGAGKGLHARPGYAKCETCHVEHNGRSADLVWWGKAGRATFDHGQTGYVLEGAHVRQACEACHKPKATRTFLGLGTACTPCHADVHRGQLGAGDCRSCHGMERWKPAAGFDHSRTRYALTGRHVSVGCDKCHPAAAGAASDPSLRRFRGVAFAECSSCHRDPHQARLGPRCASCHTTAGWAARTAATTSFDHDRTSYPLRGRHATVACDRCHAQGKPLRMAHAACTDCHADAHRGELAARAERGRCESCHDVAGWRPARFGPDEHAKTAYPLRGAHLAVACDGCHSRPAGARTAAFRVRSARCTDCHKDPHRGELARWMGATGCESCHTVASWRAFSFDHGTTKFALAGAHAAVACAKCHKKAPGTTRISFAALPLTCEGCHSDSHAAQFVAAGVTKCARCHSAAAWKPAPGFDHAKDARYHLDGAHARVACWGCHKTETRDGRTFVRYKPLRSECRDCHASGGKA